MSVQAMGWVLDHSPMQGAERLVLLAIANHADKKPGSGAWEAWPGIELIRKEARLNRTRTVQEVLARLVEAKAVERVINGAPDRRIPNDKRPTFYRILLSHGEQCGDTDCTWCGIREVSGNGTPDSLANQENGVTPDAARGAVSRSDGVSGDDFARCRETAPKPSYEPSCEPVPQPREWRPEVAALCERLAESISKRDIRPVVSERWMIDMDLMLRKDERDPEQVGRVIAWLDAGADDVALFWRANVRSPRKLRARWGHMADQYQALRARSGATPQEQADDVRSTIEAMRDKFDPEPDELTG